MFCEKCGAQLQAGAKFCTVCGYAVNNSQVTNIDSTINPQQYDYNPGMNNTDNNNNDFGYSVNNNSFVDDGFGAQMQPNPIPKSKKTPVLVGIFAVLAVVAVLAGLYFTLGKNLFATPVDKTIKALKNLTKVEAVDVTTELKLKLEGSSSNNILVKDVIEGMAIKVGGKYDQNKKQGAFDIALNYKKVPVVELKAYMDEDVIVLESDQLLDEPLYASLEDLEELAGEDLSGMYGTMPVDVKKLEAYEKFIKDIQEDSKYKAVSKNYGDFFEEVLSNYVKKNGAVKVAVVEGGKEKIINTDEIEMTINDAFIKKVVKGLLKKVVEDKDLKALIKDKVQEFYDIAEENGDLEAMDLDEEFFEEFIAEFDDNWDEAMYELEDALDELEDELAALEFNSTAKFRIDSNNRLRQLTYELETGELFGEAMGMDGLKGSLVIETTYNAFDGDVKIEKTTTDGGRNLAEMDEYELMDIMGSITEKLQQAIMSTFGGGF